MGEVPQRQTRIVRFPLKAQLSRGEFEELVGRVLDELPEDFREKLDNVEIVVEEWPDRQTMGLAKVRDPFHLLGFYHGVPQTKRTHSYGLVLPDKISIYQGPIEMQCDSVEQIAATVRRVLLHEIGHHFGIGDERLREIGAY